MKRADFLTFGGGKAEMNNFLKNGGAKTFTRFYPDRTENLSAAIGREIYPEESAEDLRLKKMLRRAVEKAHAPQRLIDSIRNGIRR
jgi:hypothetical protein